MDEVQTGFGRAGEFFWMYESQGMHNYLYAQRQRHKEAGESFSPSL